MTDLPGLKRSQLWFDLCSELPDETCQNIVKNCEERLEEIRELIQVQKDKYEKGLMIAIHRAEKMEMERLKTIASNAFAHRRCEKRMRHHRSGFPESGVNSV